MSPPPPPGGAGAGAFPCTAPSVQRLVLSKKRAPLARLDVWPWGLGYAVALNFFLGAEADAVLPSVALGFVVVSHVFAFLFQAWSIRWRHFVRTVPAASLSDADCVLVLPVEHAGAAEIVDLVRVADATDDALPLPGALSGGSSVAGALAAAHALEGKSNAELAATWLRRARLQFTYQNMVFHLVEDEAGQRAFAPLQALDAAPLSVYQGWRGWSSKQAAAAASKFGSNVIHMPLPTFGALMAEHIVAPFFVFQVACVALWMLDEYWYYSLFTLFMLVSMEAVLVQQRIKQHQSLRGMRPPPGSILVYRDAAWRIVSTEDCVPGDIVSLVRFKASGSAAPAPPRPGAPPAPDNAPVAADALILRGTVVVNEAMLTGESTPLMKDAVVAAGDGGEALEEAEHGGNGKGDNGRSPVLNAFLAEGSRSHARHVVYGGTTLLQTSPHSEAEDAPGGGRRVAAAAAGGAAGDIPLPFDGGATAVLLRTGVATSQGDLMRTIVHSTRKVTSGNREAFIFICGLLVFAVSASAYVLYHGLQDPSASRYKLTLHCIMVITSVVPPELPIELALAVNNAIAALAKRGIFCTEPFRITFGGMVDVAAFDKTGTLTADEFTVQGIGVAAGAASAGAASAPIGGDMVMVGVGAVPLPTLHVLAGCHSVMAIETTVPPPPPPPRRPFDPTPPPPPAAPTIRIDLIGDPLERAALKALKWTVGFDGVTRPAALGHAPVSSLKDIPRLPYVRTVKRWPFSAAMKRMTCAVSVCPDASASPAAQLAASQLCLVTKGAPEVIAPLLTDVPAGYQAAYQSLAVKGYRVLALAHRPLAGSGASVVPGGPTAASAVVKGWNRAQAEAPGTMAFAGFLVLASPLKTDSKRVISELRASGHRVMMITGDAALTAVAVGVQTGIIDAPSGAQAAEEAAAWILDVTSGGGGGGAVAPGLEWQVLPLAAVAGSAGTGSTTIAATASEGEEEGATPALARAEDAVIRRQAFAPSDLVVHTAAVGPLAPRAAMCVTGAAMHALMRGAGAAANAELVRVLCERAVVFSRVSPDQKEHVIVTLNQGRPGADGAPTRGLTTLMCGDGTNDVGALKQASVGVSIISNAELEKKYDLNRLQNHRKMQELLAGGANPPPPPPMDAPFREKMAYAQKLQAHRALLARSQDEVDEDDTELTALLKEGGASTTLNAPPEGDALEGLLKKATAGLEAQAAAAAERSGNAAAGPAAPGGLLAKLKEMESEAAAGGVSTGPVMVALGDASIASPFTSKLPSPAAVLDILRQGRTALVVVQQMYRILAVNSLVSSVTLSALYLYGVRSGDTQATVAGIMISAMFMAVSWAGPLKKLSQERPRTTVFNTPLLLSVFGQAAIHLTTLLTVVWACAPYMDKNIPSPFAADPVVPAGAALSIPGVDGGANDGGMGAAAAAGVDALKSALLARSHGSDDDGEGWESNGLASILGGSAAGEPEAPRFKPNVLNTAVFLISLTQQTVTFLVNYTGKPFMQPLKRGSFIVKATAVIFSFALVMCLGWVSSIREQLELVELPSDWGYGPVAAVPGEEGVEPTTAFHVSVRLTTAFMILLDGILCWSLEQGLRARYGIGTKPRLA